jgi:hypothetical protein
MRQLGTKRPTYGGRTVVLYTQPRGVDGGPSWSFLGGLGTSQGNAPAVVESRNPVKTDIFALPKIIRDGLESQRRALFCTRFWRQSEMSSIRTYICNKAQAKGRSRAVAVELGIEAISIYQRRILL